jgi:hypothetical protein
MHTGYTYYVNAHIDLLIRPGIQSLDIYVITHADHLKKAFHASYFKFFLLTPPQEKRFLELLASFKDT